MLEAYRAHVEERAQQGIPPLPLNAEQVNDLVELLKNPPAGEEDFLLDLLTERGVEYDEFIATLPFTLQDSAAV